MNQITSIEKEKPLTDHQENVIQRGQELSNAGIQTFLTSNHPTSSYIKDGKLVEGRIYDKAPVATSWGNYEGSFEDHVAWVKKVGAYPDGLCIKTGINSRVFALDFDCDMDFKAKVPFLMNASKKAFGKELKDISQIDCRENNDDKQVSAHILIRTKHSNKLSEDELKNLYSFPDIIKASIVDGKIKKKTQCEIKSEGHIITISPHEKIKNGKPYYLDVCCGNLVTLPEVDISDVIAFYSMLEKEWGNRDEIVELMKKQNQQLSSEKRREKINNGKNIDFIHHDSHGSFSDFVEKYNSQNDIEEILSKHGYQFNADGSGIHPESSKTLSEPDVRPYLDGVTLFGASDKIRFLCEGEWPNKAMQKGIFVNPYMVTLMADYHGDRGLMFNDLAIQYGFVVNEKKEKIDKKNIHKNLIKSDNEKDSEIQNLLGLSETKTSSKTSAEKLWDLIQDKDFRSLAGHYKFKFKEMNMNDNAILLQTLDTHAKMNCKKVIAANHQEGDGFFCNTYIILVTKSGNGKTGWSKETSKPMQEMQKFNEMRCKFNLGTGMSTLYSFITGGGYNVPKKIDGPAISEWIEAKSSDRKLNFWATKPTFFCVDEIASAIDTHKKFGEKEAFILIYETDPTGNIPLEKDMSGGRFFITYGHATNISGATQPSRWNQSVLGDDELRSNGYIGRFIVFTPSGVADDIHFIKEKNDEEIYRRLAQKASQISNGEIKHTFSKIDISSLNYSNKIEREIEYVGGMSKFCVNAQKLAAPLKLLGLTDQDLQEAFKLILDILVKFSCHIIQLCMSHGLSSKTNSTTVRVQGIVDSFMKSPSKSLSVGEIATQVIGKIGNASEEIVTVLERDIDIPVGAKFYYYKNPARKFEIRGIEKVID